ncbi:MAG: retroviral-like aspartic protease family protein [Gemmatimonadota bacterium]|nr:retroviral-like aspartic protease family protein [Gemmatimonadota bacterium]
MVAKSLLALLVLAACTSAPRVERAALALSYWEALSRLQSERAITSARTSAERQFAESLHSIMIGDITTAEQGFGALRRSVSDSVIRSASRVMHIATLQYLEKWQELAELARDTTHPKTVRPDKAAIELWALAFSHLPPRTVEFRARSETIPMSVSAVGTPLVPVQIGSREFHFWLDTGSSMTMLASDVARSLGVTPLVSDTLEIVTSTGRIVAQPGLIPELRLGQLIVRNVPTMVVDETMMRMREPKPIGQGPHLKIDGIIGFDIIRRLDIEVDYSDGMLTLRDPAHSSPTRQRNMFWVGLPVVQLTSTDGIPLHFALDTGSQLTFVTENLLEKLNLQASRVESRRVGGLGGEISMRAPVLADLRVRLRGFPILFRGAVVRAPVYQVLAALDGVLGGDIWGTGAVRIDVSNGVFGVRRPQRD